MIELKEVCHTYMQESVFSHDALVNINLEIHENEFIAIIGHTGSGKSTLISHINGLLQPSSGTVLVDGIDMANIKLRKKGRSLVGMVFQYPEYQLFEETVAKDIAFGPKNMGCDEAECEKRAFMAMNLVGLDVETFANKSPFELSGGEKRRAALAGIIAMQPKYLVLDEPMAGLDPMGRKMILETILRLHKELPCSVVMVSHSMDDVAKVATRVVVMQDGKIIMNDTPSVVFSNSRILKESGLDIPTATKIADGLREKGISVPQGICNMNELADFVTGSLKKC